MHTRFGWVRLVAPVATVGYVGLLHVPEVAPSLTDWSLALACSVLVFAGGRWPSAVALGQGALLLTASLTAPIAAGVAQVFACLALGETVFRAPGWRTAVAAVAVGAASAANVSAAYSPAANALVVLLDVGVPLLVGSYLRASRELARAAQERGAEIARRRQWELAAVRAAERGEIARELHDVVAHHVAAIVLRVGALRHGAPRLDPATATALDDVGTIGRQAMTDLRRLLTVLRTPGAQPTDDLPEALTAAVQRARRAGVDVRYGLTPETLADLGTETRHCVLRTVQEGLTNVLKHAGAGTSAAVTLRRTTAGLRIEVTDDGAGTQPRAVPDSGHGLAVMRERVELLDGTLHAGPTEHGWRLRADLPADSGDAS